MGGRITERDFEEAIPVEKQLNFLPKDEVEELTFKSITDSQKDPEAVLEEHTGYTGDKPFDRLKYAKKDHLVSIIQDLGVNDREHLDYLYHQYKFGHYPNLSLYETTNLEEKGGQLIEDLEEEFENKNRELEADDSPSIKDLEIFDVEEEDSVLEIKFEYNTRIDFTDPETREASYIYGLERGFVWLDIESDFLVIGSRRSEVRKEVKDLLETIYEKEFSSREISSELSNRVFGVESLRHVNQELVGQRADHSDRWSLSDDNLPDTEEFNSEDNMRRTTFSGRVVEFSERSVYLTISSRKGHISIQGKMRIGELRHQAVSIIREIREEIDNLEENDYYEYAKTLDEAEISSLEEDVTNKAKPLVLQIAGGMIQAYRAENNQFLNMDISTVDLLKDASDYFQFETNIHCENCNTQTYFCPECNSEKSLVPGLSEGDLILECLSCSTEIELDELECAEGHTLSDQDIEISAYPYLETHKIIENTLDEIGENEIEEDEKIHLQISDTSLFLVIDEEEYYVPLEEISTFQNLPDRSEIGDVAENTYNEDVVELGEKCENEGSQTCRNCIFDQQGECLRRLVGVINEGAQLDPHSGHEFGDLSFEAEVDNSTRSVIIHMKADAKPENQHLTKKRNSKLWNQVSSMMHSLNGNQIIIPMATNGFDNEFKEMMKYFANCTRSYISFIGTDETFRIRHKYSEIYNQGEDPGLSEERVEIIGD